MMPMMQLGIGMMNVFDNYDDYDEMMIMFNMTIRTDMIVLMNRNEQIPSTNGDIMMPMMQLGI